MNRPDARDLEIQALRDRLTRMCEACHRINESLDLDTVLQEVLDSARSLTGALYGVMVLLSAYGRDQVIARALEAGAEDYVVKPFSPTELVARVQTVLRRRAASELTEPPEPYRRGELTIDYAERRVSLAGSAVPLTNIEYRLLFELSVNAGRVLTHEQLLQRVWGPEHSGQPSLPVFGTPPEPGDTFSDLFGMVYSTPTSCPSNSILLTNEFRNAFDSMNDALCNRFLSSLEQSHSGDIYSQLLVGG